MDSLHRLMHLIDGINLMFASQTLSAYIFVWILEEFIKEEYGGKICFMGGTDVRLMSLDDPKPIEKEIKEKFEVTKRGGGYIYITLTTRCQKTSASNDTREHGTSQKIRKI